MIEPRVSFPFRLFGNGKIEKGILGEDDFGVAQFYSINWTFYMLLLSSHHESGEEEGGFSFLYSIDLVQS